MQLDLQWSPEKTTIFSRTDLRHIASLASTPSERLQLPFVPAGGNQCAAAVSERVAAWMQHVSKGDATIFKRVLGWRGIDMGFVQGGLGDVALPDGHDLPAWLADLQRMTAGASGPENKPAYLDAGEPLPNEALFVPFVEAASRGPLNRLCSLGAAPLVLARAQRRLLVTMTHVAASALATPGARQDFPHRACMTFPVLARLLTQYWCNWIDATEELLQRLEADRDALATFLGGPPGPPIGLQVEDADGHDGGRTVLTVAFENGARVVYKPRDMAIDLAFGHLVGWLGTVGLDLAGTVPRVLARGGYGWAEFARHRHAADDGELERFWDRSGMVLGVLTALGGNDMHAGNVIAAGDRLVLVDLETVLRPKIRDSESTLPDQAGATGQRAPLHRSVTPHGSAFGALAELLATCPIATGMLPSMLHLGDGNFMDIGGLTAPGMPDARHRAAAGPIESELARFHPALERGFRRAMRAMRDNAASLLAADGPLAAFSGAAIRLVFRDTSIYARLLKLTCEADVLRDGADRDVALERLARMLAPFASPPPYVGVVEAEKRAMEALDIPRFDAAADGTDLRDHDGVVVRDMFATDTITEARRFIAALTDADEDLHCRALGLAIQARLVGHAAAMPVPILVPVVPGPSTAQPGGDTHALEGARAIGRMLQGLAIAGPGGDLAWMCTQHRAERGFMLLAGPNPGLGDGSLGVAVFFAALAQVTGDAEFAATRDGALAAFQAPAQAAKGYSSLVAPPPGMLDGLGGRLWGLAAIARLGGPAWALELAAASLHTALEGPLARDWTLADGMAGLLLGGLALHDAAPGAADPAALRRLAAEVALRVTALLDGQEMPATGLALGLAGGGHALTRAATQLRAPELQEIAIRALTVPAGNGGPGWGRGAAGRLLALHAAAAAFPAEQRLVAPLAAARLEVAGSGLDDLADGVWNGRAGLLAALETAGVPHHAKRLEAHLAAAAQAGQLRTVLPALRGVVIPGLLNGVAGVGYALVRAAWRPGDAVLPDLLLFQ